MASYLNKHGIEAFVGPKKKYSTDANLAGLSHEAEDLESIETSMLIVEPEMGTWPKGARARPRTTPSHATRAPALPLRPRSAVR